MALYELECAIKSNEPTKVYEWFRPISAMTKPMYEFIIKSFPVIPSIEMLSVVVSAEPLLLHMMIHRHSEFIKDNRIDWIPYLIELFCERDDLNHPEWLLLICTSYEQVKKAADHTSHLTIDVFMFRLYETNCEWCFRLCEEESCWPFLALHGPLLLKHLDLDSEAYLPILKRIDFGEFDCTLYDCSNPLPRSILEWFIEKRAQTGRPVTLRERFHYFLQSYLHFPDMIDFVSEHMNEDILELPLVIKALQDDVSPIVLDRMLSYVNVNKLRDFEPFSYVNNEYQLKVMLRYVPIDYDSEPTLLIFLWSKGWGHLFHPMEHLYRRFACTRMSDGTSPFHVCDTVDQILEIRHRLDPKLVETMMDVANQRAGPFFETALFRAVRKDNVSVARWWLLFGMNPNKRDRNGDSPLHVASSLEIAEELIKKGARPTAKNKKGWIPIDSHIAHGRVEIVNFLSSISTISSQIGKKRKSPLDLAGNHTKMVEYLIRNGWNPNKKDSMGCTMWHHWAYHRRYDVLETALENVLYVKIRRNRTGYTPFHYLSSPNDDRSAELILDLANKVRDRQVKRCVKLETQHGKNPLYYATHPNTVRSLIILGAVPKLPIHVYIKECVREEYHRSIRYVREIEKEYTFPTDMVECILTYLTVKK